LAKKQIYIFREEATAIKIFIFLEQNFFAYNNSGPAVIPIPVLENYSKKALFSKTGDFPFHRG